MHPNFYIQDTTETIVMGMQKRQAILSFLDHEDAIFATQKPFYSNMPFSKTPGASTTNIKSVQHEISIANIRGFEDKFSLDRNGFELVSHSTKFNAWKDGERLVQEHYPVMEDFLRKKLGAEEVVIYDHTVRRSRGFGERCLVAVFYLTMPCSSGQALQS